MTQVGRALEQIEAIHAHLARGEVYRGWRSIPVAVSGLVGLLAGAWQAAAAQPQAPMPFTVYWLAVGVVALGLGCAEIVWHYVGRASATERRRSRRVVSQFLPSLAAGLVLTTALVRLDPNLAVLLPGLWALMFGVGVFAARPYLPAASALVVGYYWVAALVLLWRADAAAPLWPWAVGGTFGVGQLLAAAVLYISLERAPRRLPSDAHLSTDDPRWDHDAKI